MGYSVFVRADLSQNFVIQHVPESTRTYTEYKTIEKRDRDGKIIETLRIPEEKIEIIPAHDVPACTSACRGIRCTCPRSGRALRQSQSHSVSFSSSSPAESSGCDYISILSYPIIKKNISKKKKFIILLLVMDAK